MSKNEEMMIGIMPNGLNSEERYAYEVGCDKCEEYMKAHRQASNRREISLGEGFKMTQSPNKTELNAGDMPDEVYLYFGANGHVECMPAPTINPHKDWKLYRLVKKDTKKNALGFDVPECRADLVEKMKEGK